MIATSETDQHVVLHGIDWETYEGILAALGPRRLRHTYVRGEFEIMSPLTRAGACKRLIARMIETLSLELDLPIQSIGSTTLKHAPIERGLEPDECYYVQHEPQVRGKDDLDLFVDPPPDLAIEVDVTRSSLDRMAVYAELGVPELWRLSGGKLSMYRRDASGKYVEIERSDAFSLLSPAEITRFLNLRETMGETALMRSFLEWVRGQR